MDQLEILQRMEELEREITNEDIIIEAGERIAQGSFLGYLVADDDKTTTERVGGLWIN